MTGRAFSIDPPPDELTSDAIHESVFKLLSSSRDEFSRIISVLNENLFPAAHNGHITALRVLPKFPSWESTRAAVTTVRQASARALDDIEKPAF